MAKDRGSLLTRTAENVLEALESRYLLLLAGGLFLVDALTIDPLPFVDEAILFVTTVLLARWQSRRRQPDKILEPSDDETA